MCTVSVYATCFSCVGQSSGNTSFKGIYCTVHLVKEYSLRHVLVVLTLVLWDVFLPIFCIAAVYMSHWVCRSLDSVYLMLQHVNLPVTVVIMYTISFILRIFVFISHSLFICLVRLPQRKKLFLWTSINWLVFVMEIQCAFCEVGTEFLNIFSRVWMAAKIHRPPKVIAFNANGFWRRRYELSKQLQDLYINVALLSETQLKPHETFFIPNYHFYWTVRFPRRKGIPHYHVDLCYMCDTYTWQRWSLFIRDRPILSSEKCHIKTMTARGQLQKKIIVVSLKELGRQDELIGGKLPVVK
jgi:hypothetical protein